MEFNYVKLFPSFHHRTLHNIGYGILVQLRTSQTIAPHWDVVVLYLIKCVCHGTITCGQHHAQGGVCHYSPESTVFMRVALSDLRVRF